MKADDGNFLFLGNSMSSASEVTGGKFRIYSAKSVHSWVHVCLTPDRPADGGVWCVDAGQRFQFEQ